MPETTVIVVPDIGDFKNVPVVDVLVKVGDVVALETPLIGINNRDLVTFETDISLSETLAPGLPPGSLGVSESGIRSGADIVRLSRAGIHAFLIGEQFMISDDPGKALAELLRSAGGGE